MTNLQSKAEKDSKDDNDFKYQAGFQSTMPNIFLVNM